MSFAKQTAMPRCRTTVPSTTVARHVRSVRPRVLTVRTRASLKQAGDFISQAFLRIFTAADDKGVNWKGTTTPFQGKITRGKRGPYDNVPTEVKQETTTSAVAMDKGDSAALEQENKEQPTAEAPSYLAGALQRLIGHNFKGDDTEPDWKKSGNNFSGKIHTRGNDGFHSKKL